MKQRRRIDNLQRTDNQRMDRLQFYLEPSLNRELDRLASECNVSKAELIRDGVRHIVEEYQAVEDDPLFDIVGAGEGEVTDGSVEHDKYLYGSP
ncbi:MAG: hypothetical protein ACYCW5_04705 [Thermoleophilia bacterium]